MTARRRIRKNARMKHADFPTARSWRAFAAAPHRMLFFAGAAQIVLTMSLWLFELLSRASGWGSTAPLVLPALWAHAFLMLYAVFPFFIFGFLLTVYPRWMAGAEVPARRYVPVFLFLVCGWLLYYAGLFVSRPVLMLAVVLVLIGWILALVSLFDVYRRARTRGPHEAVLNLALCAGAAGQLAYLHGLATDNVWSFLLARELGLWLFLVPVVFSVGHRMIPFFSASALRNYTVVRPAWSLPLFGAGVVAHAVLEFLGQVQWLFIVDLPLAVAVLYHSYVWCLARSLEVRLLAMLHIAFAWLGLGLVLYALQSLVLTLAGASVLGRAPLHAVGVGLVAGMVVAMAARVSLGHSGRALVADRFTWNCFLGVNVAALLRIFAELFAGAANHWLNAFAALVWLGALLPWAWRYAPMYLRPRVDGKPG